MQSHFQSHSRISPDAFKKFANLFPVELFRIELFSDVEHEKKKIVQFIYYILKYAYNSCYSQRCFFLFIFYHVCLFICSPVGRLSFIALRSFVAKINGRHANGGIVNTDCDGCYCIFMHVDVNTVTLNPIFIPTANA